MDREMRELQRAVRADPRDAAARAKLTLAERHAGHGIKADVEPDALFRVLKAPWVATDRWICIWTGFKEVTILRPGRVQQVKGFQPWMGVTVRAQVEQVVAPILDERLFKMQTACLVGRNPAEIKHPMAAEMVSQLNQRLIAWAKDGTTEVKIKDGQVEETHTVTRSIEIWSIEHVRAHCGLDPLQPSEPLTRQEALNIVIKTCDVCRSVKGRLRPNGYVLCYDCNKEQEWNGGQQHRG